jgi:hypothetical protein
MRSAEIRYFLNANAFSRTLIHQLRKEEETRREIRKKRKTERTERNSSNERFAEASDEARHAKSARIIVLIKTTRWVG